MAKWTFLTNHALVLVHVAKHDRVTARQLSIWIGITERAIRKIINDLETEGYLKKAKEGRRVRYEVNSKLPFRHHTQQDKAIGNLLKSLHRSSKRKSASRQQAMPSGRV